MGASLKKMKQQGQHVNQKDAKIKNLAKSVNFMPKLWKCPKCKREFAKTRQQHSCTIYDIDKHFAGKDYARKLFNFLVSEINKKVGKIKIESLPCCIHFVSNYTFGAAWALKDGIRIDFRLDHKIDTKKSYKVNHISANRYLYYLDIKNKKEIDSEFLTWIKEAYSQNAEG